jgi:hypothetical protein
LLCYYAQSGLHKHTLTKRHHHSALWGERTIAVKSLVQVSRDLTGRQGSKQEPQLLASTDTRRGGTQNGFAREHRRRAVVRCVKPQNNVRISRHGTQGSLRVGNVTVATRRDQLSERGSACAVGGRELRDVACACNIARHQRVV